jgi:hypothetical protein
MNILKVGSVIVIFAAIVAGSPAALAVCTDASFTGV